MISRNLKLLLKRDSVSIIQLSKTTGINTKTLYNYLDGRTPRELRHIKTLCDYFKVTADFLLFGTEPAILPSSEMIELGRFDVYLKKAEK